MIRRLAGTTVILFILATATRTDTFRSNAVARINLPDTTRRGPVTGTDSLRSLERLATDIGSLIDLPAEVKAGKVGVEVRSLSTRKVLFRMNPDKPLTPASNTKVVTTFTALSELGPNYNVRTIIAADARPQGGTVHGNLYVKGYGDPFLSINEIDALIDGVIDAGIRQIDGNIVGDGSFFDNKTERTEYSGDADPVENLPPIEALTIDRGGFTVVVSSPRTPDSPCNVQTFPHSYAFEIVNSAVSAAARPAPRRGKKRADLDAPIPGARPADELPQLYGDAWPADRDGAINQRHPAGKGAQPVTKGTATRKGAAPKKVVAKEPVKEKSKKVAARPAPVQPAPARTEPAPAAQSRGALKVSLSPGENGRQMVTVTGSLPPNRTVSYHFRMKNPPLVIAGMVYDRLRSHGVQIGGGIASGQTPARGKVIAEAGRPLIEILHYVMKNSNNFLAEYVFKMIGGAAGGQQETARKSVERIEQRMVMNHVAFGRCIINDGSGLSRANCLSATVLSSILDAAHNDRKLFDAFYSVMSIAGVDGTLRHRMRGTFAQGNVHGKTGTLNNVSALTGYVTTRDGELLCFSMLMNGGNHGAYRAVQDRVAARLAAFSYAAPIQEIPAAAQAK